MIKVIIENFKGHHLSLDFIQKKVYIRNKIRFISALYVKNKNLNFIKFLLYVILFKEYRAVFKKSSTNE